MTRRLAAIGFGYYPTLAHAVTPADGAAPSASPPRSLSHGHMSFGGGRGS